MEAGQVLNHFEWLQLQLMNVYVCDTHSAGLYINDLWAVFVSMSSNADITSVFPNQPKKKKNMQKNATENSYALALSTEPRKNGAACGLPFASCTRVARLGVFCLPQEPAPPPSRSGSSRPSPGPPSSPGRSMHPILGGGGRIRNILI